MFHHLRTPRIVKALAIVTSLVVAGLGAQIGAAYRCSMACHDIAQRLMEDEIAIGVDEDSARDRAFSNYLSCIGTFCS